MTPEKLKDLCYFAGIRISDVAKLSDTSISCWYRWLREPEVTLTSKTYNKFVISALDLVNARCCDFELTRIREEIGEIKGLGVRNWHSVSTTPPENKLLLIETKDGDIIDAIIPYKGLYRDMSGHAIKSVIKWSIK